MTTISIPADCVPILRSALLSEIGIPAGRIEQASMSRNKEKHPERFLKPLAEIDEHRAVLEVLGWADPAAAEPVSLDLDAHRAVVSRSLHTRLDVERDYMAVDPDAKGAERQRSLATYNARIIEEFLTAHGLVGGE
jgi:hypothetical protein